LTTIPAGLAPLCPRLTELAVSNNRLKDVPRSILYLPRVTELNLSFNKIEAVDVLQAPELQVLRINSNYVSSLDNMSYLRKLHTLHMDNCHMSQLTSHMKKLKALTYLDLSHNTLVSLALPSREASESLSGKGKHGTNASDQPTAVVAATAALGDTREWEEVLDPFTGRKSYFCKATKEVRRTKPPGFDLQQAKREQKMRAQRQRQLETAEAMGLRPPEVPSNVTEDLVLRPATASISLISTKLGNAPLWQQCIDEGEL
jgi:Leucine rich repeat